MRLRNEKSQKEIILVFGEELTEAESHLEQLPVRLGAARPDTQIGVHYQIVAAQFACDNHIDVECGAILVDVRLHLHILSLTEYPDAFDLHGGLEERGSVG